MHIGADIRGFPAFDVISHWLRNRDIVGVMLKSADTNRPCVNDTATRTQFVAAVVVADMWAPIFCWISDGGRSQENGGRL